MPQSVLSLTKVQTSASAEGEGNRSTFPLRDTSHVPSHPTRPLWAQRSALPPQSIVRGLHAGSLGLPGLQLTIKV